MTSGPNNGYESYIYDINAFNSATGKKHQLFSRYVSLGHVLDGTENQDGKSASEWADYIIKEYDGVPVIFLVPWDSGLDLGHKYDDQKTAQDHINEFANSLKIVSHNGENTIIIVFGHEMDAQKIATDHPEKFVSIFQYASDRFHDAGCQMCWCTVSNDNPFTSSPKKMIWWPGSENTNYSISRPGKDYVDWVAQTRYHFWWNANTFSGLKGESQSNPEQAWYNYFGKKLGFPLMFAETAGQKPAPYIPSPNWNPNPLNKGTQDFSNEWIPNLYNAQNLASNYPLIKGIIWFDTYKFNDNGQPEQNYLIPPGTWVAASQRVSPLTNDVYKSLISDPYFYGTTFSEPEDRSNISNNIQLYLGDNGNSVTLGKSGIITYE